MVDLVKCVDSKTRSCGVAFARGMMGRAYLASGGVWSSEKKETCTALMCKLCRRLTIQLYRRELLARLLNPFLLL